MRRPLLDTKPKDVLEPTWVSAYETKIDVLWGELVNLNAYLFILKKLIAFPWSLFGPHSPDNLFWKAVRNSLTESSILTIWRVAVDNSNAEGITIAQLKNEILQNIKPEYKDEFFAELKKSEFERRREQVEANITELRHNYLAHRNLRKMTLATEDDVEARTLPIDKLEQYVERLREFYRVLCFGVAKHDFPLGYSPLVERHTDKDPRRDIEKLLDDIALQSPVMKAADRGGLEWDIQRSVLSTEKLQVLNTYRRRFGKSEV